MNDILAVLFGVAIGVLASVPVAMVIAVSTQPRARSRDDLPALDVPAVEVPQTSVTVWEARP